MTTRTERIREQQRGEEGFPLADALKLAAVALERLSHGLCPQCAGVLAGAGRRGRCRYCPWCGFRYQA